MKYCQTKNLKGSTKYHNRKIQTAFGTFDSQKEYLRFIHLKISEDMGYISDLQRQVAFELIPSQKNSKGTERAVKYIADFVYTKDGKKVVEDTKGYKTPEYIIKRKLMLFIHGIEVQEI